MSIYLTGDIHGEIDRLSQEVFPELDKLTKEDYVIVCGDFGVVWNGEEAEQAELDELEARPFTTLFVDGNHENFDLLREYPTIPWHGGVVHAIRPSVLHLLRGEVYELEGLRFFTMGGASSHDISDGILEPDAPDFSRRYRMLLARDALFRVNHRSWWKEELPDQEDYRRARDSLERANWQVDCIITHCCPTSVLDAIGHGMFQSDPLTDFLEEVAQRCRFRQWFFGHYHMDGHVGEQFIHLYQELIQLTRTHN